MSLLILGLALFLGVHSVSIVAPQWRDAQAARLGENAWKGIYTLLSLAGFALIVIGYGRRRPVGRKPKLEAKATARPLSVPTQ